MQLHWRRGQQKQAVDDLLQLVGEPVRQRGTRLPAALASAPHSVCLVENHQVPFGLDDLLGALRACRKRQRADHVRPGHPGVHSAATQILRRGPVYNLEVVVELQLQLALPLQLKASGDHDQDAAQEFTGTQFLDDQAGLDGLAEANLVREDHPRLELLGNAVRGIDLVQLRLDPRTRQSGQRVVAVRVFQVQCLKPELVWLTWAEFAGC